MQRNANESNRCMHGCTGREIPLWIRNEAVGVAPRSEALHHRPSARLGGGVVIPGIRTAKGLVHHVRTGMYHVRIPGKKSRTSMIGSVPIVTLLFLLDFSLEPRS